MCWIISQKTETMPSKVLKCPRKKYTLSVQITVLTSFHSFIVIAQKTMELK